MVTTDDMISAARDALGMYLKDGVSTPRANRTTAPVNIPGMVWVVALSAKWYFGLN